MTPSLPATRSGIRLLAATCVASLLILALHPAAMADQFETSRAEWSVYLRQSPELRAADGTLNATYKKIVSALSQADKNSLIAEQRVWIRERNKDALARHPKGSSEYCRVLAEETLRRAAILAERYPVQHTEKALAPVPVLQEPPPPDAAPLPLEPTPPAPVAPAKPAQPTQPARESAQPTPEPTPKPSRAAKARSRTMNITPALFAQNYNQLARSFQTALFPSVPTGVTESGSSRTEQYRLSETVSMQFKYADGNFDNPEIITFIAHRYMNGSTRDKDDVAYALGTTLKTLTKESPKDPEAKDAEILGFMRSIRNAFSSDASRVWKNGGLMYVITYLQKSDLFALVVTRDDGKR